MYAKQKQVLESFVRVRTFLEDHPATGSIILEDLLRRICRSRARAPHTSTGFRTLLDRWQSQRLALLNQHRHDELVEHWPARFDACAGRLVRDAATLLISARLDAASGIERAGDATRSWFIDPQVFSREWIETVHALTEALDLTGFLATSSNAPPGQAAPDQSPI